MPSPTDPRLRQLLVQAREQLESERLLRTEPIAIVGIGCRFPGGIASPEGFIDFLETEKEAIVSVPTERWNNDAVYSSQPNTPGKLYSRAGGFLPEVDRFEPEVFGISPREAVALDPQQRLLLEVAWEAFEDAGYAPDRLQGAEVGVWVGMSLDDYARRASEHPLNAHVALGNTRSVAAGRIAYSFGLGGPTLQLDTACSSSLVAVHLACQSLRQRECDAGLVGGVNLLLAPDSSIALCRLGALSPDDRCHTFSASANGYVRGEGCGLVVLKRLSDALAAGDRVYAVVRGSAVNHNGHSNGLTAPSGNAQQAVMRKALKTSGLGAAEVGFVEAQGTGTPLGDLIELGAVAAVYSAARDVEKPLLLGALKTRLGHTESASGVASLIKTALSLHTGRVFPNRISPPLHPKFPWERSNLKVATEPSHWNEARRAAGVSSFGMSGTNAHVILSTPPGLTTSENAAPALLDSAAPPHSPGAPQLLVLSSRVAAGIPSAAGKLADFLEARGVPAIADLSFTLLTARALEAQRATLVVEDATELRTQLAKLRQSPAERPSSFTTASNATFVFAGDFAGGGALRLGMGKELYQRYSAFRQAFDNVCQELDPRLETPLKNVVWAARGTPQAALLSQQAYAQPALFAFQWSLAALWQSIDVQPASLIGHSVGEITAACIAQVLPLRDACALVALRGRQLGELTPSGSMLAVGASAERLESDLAHYVGKVSVAAVNGPHSTVVSGATQCLEELAARWHSQQVPTEWLGASQALHSPLVEPMLADFRRFVETLKLNRPQLPLFSSVTGTAVEEQVTSASYWVRQARETVRFQSAVASAFEQGARAFVELGPTGNLLSAIRECCESAQSKGSGPGPEAPPCAVGLLRTEGGEARSWLGAVGRWLRSGGNINPSGLFADQPTRPTRIPLPKRAWQRSRYWLEARSSGDEKLESFGAEVKALLSSGRLSVDTPIGEALAILSREAERNEPAGAANDAQKGSTLGQRWPTLGETERREALGGFVDEAAQRVLAMGPGELPRDKPLKEAGLDSLMALELTSAVSRELGIALPPLLQGNPNLSEVVERLLQAAGSATEPATGKPAPLPALVRSDVRERFPATDAQKRLWFLYRIDPAAPTYNVAVQLRLEGTVEAAALKQAVLSVVARHEALRTHLRADKDGSLWQVVEPEAKAVVHFGEVSPRDTAPDRLAEWIRQEEALSFDLGSGPSIRVTLLRLGPGAHVLALTVHHTLVDGWALGLLLQELTQAYEAGEAWEPADPGPQLGDYALWEQEMVRVGRAQESATHFQHWETLPTLQLPSLGSPLKGETGKAVHFDLTSQLAVRLGAAAARAGVTLSTMLMGGFAVALSRYSGQLRFGLGSIVANRMLPEQQRIVGLLMGTGLVECDLSADLETDSWLRELEAESERLQAHAWVPTSKLLGAGSGQGDPRANQRLQAMFLHQGIFRATSGSLGQAKWSLFNRNNMANHIAGTAKAPLMLSVYPWGDAALGATLEFETGLMSEAHARRFAEHYRAALESLLQCKPLRDVDVLVRADYEEFRRWNASDRPTDCEKTAFDLFTQQVALRPNSIALTTGSRTLSFRQLADRTTNIAQQLAAAGVGPGQRIAICLPRDVDMLAGLLAIHSLGAAYVPLDPIYPTRRIAYMLEDSASSLVLTHSSIDGDTWPAAVPRYNLDAPPADCRALPCDGATDSSLAYLIYTSGSTGRPKGVCIPHSSLTNLLASMQRVLQFRSEDALLAVTTLGFDIAALELLLPLVSGGRVDLASEAEARDIQALQKRLDASGASFMQATPATWQMFRAAGAPPRPNLRVVSGGEALPPDLARWLNDTFGAVWNVYGPTETTIWSSTYRVLGDESACVPIGSPLDNTQLHVCDDRGRLRPIGTPGELWISGLGVAAGYFRREDLTRERFVPFQWLGKTAAAYRTGDLVRQRSDGLLEHLGRIDHQVKLRGFRIELGEVEVALSQHPGVRQAVSLVAGNDSQRRLVAFLVASDPNAPPDDPSVLALAEQSLPEYMLPSQLVWLPTLPLTPNGKVDRNALPDPDETRLVSSPPSDESLSPLQRSLASLWQELLAVPTVALDDDFFRLGGDSLKIVRLHARLEQLGHSVSIRALFGARSIRRLAATLQQEETPAGSDASVLDLPAIVRADTRERFPATDAQQRLWYLHKVDPTSPRYNVPLQVRIEGDLSASALKQALQLVVARHEALRTHLREDSKGDLWQWVETRPESALLFNQVTLWRATDVALHDWLRSEATAPFNLEHGPVVRATVIRVEAQLHILALTFPHTSIDGWSLGLIRDELMQAYDQGGGTPLPEVSLQLGDYALWERELGELGHTKQAAQGFAHWAELPSLLLPRSTDSQWAGGKRGNAIQFNLPNELVQGLKKTASRVGVTLTTVLMSGLSLVLARYSGQPRFGLGAIVMNRMLPQQRPIVGFLTNTGLVDCDLTVAKTTDVFLQAQGVESDNLQVRSWVPMSSLLSAGDAQGDTGANHRLQAAFLYQGLDMVSTSALGSARWSLFNRDNLANHVPGTAKAPLFLCVYPWQQESLGATLEFETGLMSEAHARRFAEHYRAALESLLQCKPLRDVDVLVRADYEEFRRWNASDRPIDCDKTAFDLFTQQVALRPDSVALTTGSRALSFRQLADHATAIAQQLAAAGVGPGQRIAICLPRDVDMLAGLLAVLKLGAAYLPVDPSYPPRRIAYMLEDSASSLVLTHSSIDGSHWPAAVPRYNLDAPPAHCRARPSDDPTDSSLAYLIYTSGSTGKPKGVCVRHSALTNLLAAMQRVLQFRPEDCMLAVTNLSFDIAALELLLPLACGGRVDLATEMDARDIQALQHRLDTGGASLMQATPATWQMFRAAASIPRPHVRVLSGGEALLPDLARWLTEHFGAVWNGYGPSETTIYSSTYRVLGDESAGVPIGSPLDNTQLHVCDELGRLRPIGTPGELWISGLGVAAGYFRREDLTRERFVPFQWLGKTAAAYRTGDLVRQRSDGLLEHLGRIDHQVKLRGFRIELGEVEVALSQHPGVRQAVSLVAGNDSQRRLVAFLVASDPNAPPDDPSVLALAEQSLPEYMLPSQLVWLPTLPLTPNGKVDRNALPDPDETRLVSSPPSDESLSPLQRSLASLWQELLAVPTVALDDDFFRLGGDSLKIVRLHARLRQLGFHPAIRTLFRARTLRQLAAALDAPESDATHSIEARLRADVHLEPALSVAAAGRTKPGDALVTGVACFLGAHVLHEVAKDASVAKLYALVPERTRGAARQRIEAAFRAYGLARANLERVEFLCGDLSQPRLGLNESTWDNLASSLERIYHGAARVNHALGYDDLRASNVGAMKDILRLAAASGSRVCFLSSLAVFDPEDYAPGTELTEQTLPKAPVWASGFAQSKWVAERIVELAKARGVVCHIVRLPMTTGHSRTGVVAHDDLFPLFLKAAAATGALPNWPHPIQSAPVDLVAEWIAHVGRSGFESGVFHAIQEKPILMADIQAAFAGLKREVAVVPMEDFHRALESHARASGDTELERLSPLFAASNLRALSAVLGNSRVSYGRSALARSLPDGASAPGARGHLRRTLSLVLGGKPEGKRGRGGAEGASLEGPAAQSEATEGNYEEAE